MSFSDETMASIFRPSSQLLDLVQRLSLVGPEPVLEPTAAAATTTSENSGFSPSAGLSVPNIISSQDSHYSSARSSLDFAFSSLHVTAEEWASIDQEASELSSSTAAGEPEDASTQFSAASFVTPSSSISRTLPEDASELTSDRPPPRSAYHPTQEKYKFSPSVLAHHANTACEKMLHLKGSQLWQQSQIVNQHRTEDFNNDGKSRGATTVSEATMERGNIFESRLQLTIKDRVDCEAERDKDSYFRLATTPDGTTLCQPIFSLDESFYTPEMKKAGIVFGRFLPDFIRILPGAPGPDGKLKKRLYIIDAKSSSHVKISHQFQVTLYAIFLDHLIKLNKQEHLVEIDPCGGVWIPQRDEPKTFSLAFMRPIAENFIFNELPVILMKSLRSATWHIDSPCLQCEFLPDCKQDAVDQRTLSLIPLLSKKSALWVKTFFRPDSSRGSEIEDLEDLIRERASLPDVDRSSLVKIFQLDSRGTSPHLESYKRQTLQVLNVRTTDLPRQHQDRVLINILTDPMTQLPFAYSLAMFKDQNIQPTRSLSNAIPFSSKDSISRLQEHVGLAFDLINNLHEWLVQISEIPPKAPIISIFFFNQTMQSDLCALLFRVITSKSREGSAWSPVTRSRAMDLLVNMYEDPGFLTLSEVTGTSVKLPDLLQLTQGYKNVFPMHDKRLFSIEKAVKKFVVLPVVGAYSFKDIMTHMVDVKAPAIIDDRDRDDEGYNLDAIYRRWTSGTSAQEIQTTVEKWVKQQNLILTTLYRLVRQECGGDLSTVLLAPQTNFRMRSHFIIQHSILAQFAFFHQWEAIIRCERRRERRMVLSKYEAMQHQFMFRGRFLGRHVGLLPNADSNARAPRAPSNAPTSEYIGRFEITSRLNPGVLVGDTFKSWILTADNATGERDRMRFDDTSALLRAFGRGSPAIVSVPYYDPELNIAYISGAFNNMTEALQVTEGEHYILERREFSPTLATSMDKLVEMNENCRLFLELMSDPNKWGQQRPKQSADVFLESITNAARQYDMTLSQEQAFAKVISNRLQVIWGPPGSGKTHFLALTILRFIDILRSLSDKGKGQGPQTIVLTAFTHTAINNLVSRVAKLHDAIAPHFGSEKTIRPLVLYRLGDHATVQVKGVRVVEPANLVKLQRETEDASGDHNNIVRVVCGTVWQIRRAAHPKTGVEYMRNVQMLMIDEGSQLLAADAIHAIECLDPIKGRLIVAGDHLQLGPVILGEYPESEQAVDPTGSIMKNLMRKRDNTPVSLHWVEGGGAAMDIGPCTSQLQENFRMNAQLGQFMKNIYGPNYQVQNPTKSLPYSGVFRGSSFPDEIRRILDPDRSAICIELQLTKDIQCQEAVKIANDTQAAAYLEATFVTGIVEYYLDMVGPNTITSLFVAVPHHVQRLAVLRKIDLPGLNQKYPLAQIKVDTIEKMQGQEADLVVVCFALFDEFTLVNELGYLYSVHRWIVALSRARCKTVLLMTPELKAPRVMGGTGKANPGDLKSLDGWGLLQAYEAYADQMGGKLVWPISGELLRGIDMQRF